LSIVWLLAAGSEHAGKKWRARRDELQAQGETSQSCSNFRGDTSRVKDPEKKWRARRDSNSRPSGSKGDFALHANTRGTTRANEISAKAEKF
jgi:hypothetical protein